MKLTSSLVGLLAEFVGHLPNDKSKQKVINFSYLLHNQLKRINIKRNVIKRYISFPYLLVNGRVSLCRVVRGRSFVAGRSECREVGQFSEVSFMLKNSLLYSYFISVLTVTNYYRFR